MGGIPGDASSPIVVSAGAARFAQPCPRRAGAGGQAASGIGINQRNSVLEKPRRELWHPRKSLVALVYRSIAIHLMWAFSQRDGAFAPSTMVGSRRIENDWKYLARACFVRRGFSTASNYSSTLPFSTTAFPTLQERVDVKTQARVLSKAVLTPSPPHPAHPSQWHW
jgi:hypothetical protein